MFDPWKIINELTPILKTAMLGALSRDGEVQGDRLMQGVLLARNLADGIYEGEEEGTADYMRLVGVRLNEKGSIVAHELREVMLPEVDRNRLRDCWTPQMAREHTQRLAQLRAANRQPA